MEIVEEKEYSYTLLLIPQPGLAMGNNMELSQNSKITPTIVPSNPTPRDQNRTQKTSSKDTCVLIYNVHLPLTANMQRNPNAQQGIRENKTCVVYIQNSMLLGFKKW